MDPFLKDPQPPGEFWSPLRKNVFRFFFFFLGITSLFCYNIVFEVLHIGQNASQKVYSVTSYFMAWVDRHFFHIGYNTGHDLPLFADGHFGWVALPTMLIVSLAGTVVWAVADRRPRSYDRWQFWFTAYLAFYLFFPLVGYGIEKIFGAQMPYPNIVSLLTPLGQKNGQAVVWDFIGISPTYSFFTGFCEATGGVLLLFRRTRVAGALLVAAVLTNVVCLNLFYNIQVKLLCMQLLLTDLYILAPYLPKLFRLFYQLQPVSLAGKTYSLPRPWKNCLLLAVVLMTVWKTFSDVKRTVVFSVRNKENRRQQRLYDVAVFVLDKDTLPPLPADTMRWKRFAISDYQGKRYGIVFNMKDVDDWYSYQVDDASNIMTLSDFPDTTRRFTFAFNGLGNGDMSLSGKWKGKNVKISLSLVPIDSLPLVKERTTWVQDY